MKKLLIALSLILAPVAAQAQSLSTEVTTGTNFKNSDVFYGVGVGLDFNLNGRSIVGLEASAEDFADDGDTTVIYGGGRVGVKATDSTLLFANGGYVQARGDSGFRVGGGLEQNLSQNIYTKVSYRYTDFGNDTNGHGGILALGLRF